MNNLEGAGDAALLVEKSDEDGSQLELQSLEEIERQYAEHSVTRDAQLENLRKTVAKNDIILKELRADVKERQMRLERRTDEYTALRTQRSQLLELCAQGQAKLNAALKEAETLNLEVTNAETILNAYSPWNEEAMAVIAAEESAVTAGIDEAKEWLESAVNDLRMIPKNRECQAAMKKISLDFQQETFDMIKSLKKLTEENETMLSEQMQLEQDLVAMKEEHDRLQALSASKSRNVQELNMQKAEIQERIIILKETNGKRLDGLNQLNFELEMLSGYQTQLDEKINELREIKEHSEKEIEAVNAEWNDRETVHQETLDRLMEELEKEGGKLEELKMSNEVVKKDYADAKKGIVKGDDDRVRSTQCQAKIADFVGKIEKVMAKIKEKREEKDRAESSAEEMKQSLMECDLKLKRVRDERLGLSEQLEGLSRQRENERNVAVGLEKAKRELSDEKLHLIEIRTVLSDGIEKLEGKIDSLDLTFMEEAERANLKNPIMGEKIISDLANGLEKWRMEVSSLAEKGMNVLDEKRYECARRVNDAKDDIQKVRSENLALQEQISAMKRSAALLGDKLADTKRERDEFVSTMKVKKNQLANEKSEMRGSQDTSTNDENSDPNGRVLDSGSE